MEANGGSMSDGPMTSCLELEVLLVQVAATSTQGLLGLELGARDMIGRNYT